MGKRAAAVQTTNKFKEYMLYAEHCLMMAKAAPDQQSRMIQREMAAEWLKLADEMKS